MKNDVSIQGVKDGLVTFLSEGNDSPTSIAYSRKLHHPTFNSGVTIGRGYDMKQRSKIAIYHDLISVGISSKKAKEISFASTLYGRNADIFISKNRDAIGEITRTQQVSLFNKIYPSYVSAAKLRYERNISGFHACSWDGLDPAIRDVLVDIVYQGFKGTEAMKAASANNPKEFILFLKSKKEYMIYEKGRNRIGYLEKNGN